MMMTPDEISQTRDRILSNFWSKIDTKDTDVCWTWKGRVNHYGYGVFQSFYRTEFAHRFSFALTNNMVDALGRSKIPEGLFVRHKCDNPICCNPLHLELGTPKDNSQDMVKRCRHAKSGFRPPTETVIALIRKKLTYKQVGVKLGISDNTVGRIYKEFHSKGGRL